METRYGSTPRSRRIFQAGSNLFQGDDIAGIVHEVGENVVEFKKGDRVAAFHEMMKPGGSYAEYAVSWKHTTFFLPKKTSFEGTFPNLHPYVALTDIPTQRVPPFPSPP